MRVEIENSNNIVKSAFLTLSDLSMSVIINTTNRNVIPDNVVSIRGNEICQDAYTFYVSDQDDSYEQDEVRIIAENDKDEEILAWLVFTLHDKDQSWFLYCDKSVYLNWDRKQ